METQPLTPAQIPYLMPNPFSDIGFISQYRMKTDGMTGSLTDDQRLPMFQQIIDQDLYLSAEQREKRLLEQKIDFNKLTGVTIYHNTKIMDVMEDCIGVMEPLHKNTMFVLAKKCKERDQELPKSDHRQVMKLIARYAEQLEQGDDELKLRLMEAFLEGSALDKIADQWHKDYLVKKSGDITFVPVLSKAG